jgi:hypothetical protein
MKQGGNDDCGRDPTVRDTEWVRILVVGMAVKA